MDGSKARARAFQTYLARPVAEGAAIGIGLATLALAVLGRGEQFQQAAVFSSGLASVVFSIAPRRQIKATCTNALLIANHLETHHALVGEEEHSACVAEIKAILVALDLEMQIFAYSALVTLTLPILMTVSERAWLQRLSFILLLVVVGSLARVLAGGGVARREIERTALALGLTPK
jgi:hypothetical protein